MYVLHRNLIIDLGINNINIILTFNYKKTINIGFFGFFKITKKTA